MSGLDQFIYTVKSIVYFFLMFLFLAMYNDMLAEMGEEMPTWLFLVGLFVVPFILSMPYFGKADK